MLKTSTDKAKIKFLILEGIHPSAVQVLKAAGYTQIESLTGALAEDELKTRIADAICRHTLAQPADGRRLCPRDQARCRGLLLHRYQPG